MKMILASFFILVISFLLFCTGEITLYSASGVVQLKQSENATWVKASVGQKLSTGFFIYTGFNSQAVIQTNNAKIEVKALSQVSIASLIEAKDNITTEVYLKYGKVKANVDKNKEVKTVFKVRSANSTASVRGTVFFYGNDKLSVENGTVELMNDYQNNVLVQRGETAFAGKLDIIDSPLRNRNFEYFVNPLPIGFSDTEIGNIEGPIGGGGKNFTRTKATAVITIIVIQ